MEERFNWKSFVYNINSNSISLVIGNDLSILVLKKEFLSNSDYFDFYVEAGTLKNDQLYINLYKYLAIKIWDIFGKGELPRVVSMNNIVLQIQQLNTSENDINIAIREEIRNLTDDQIMLEPLRKLVRINGFETIITVNIDNFLERAFAAEGKRVNASLNFSIPSPAIDYSNRKDKALATIFNLMGNIEGFNFAITDEQCLEYIFMLQNGNSPLSKELFDTIHQKNILFAGSSFPDWFMRFFIRVISSERYKNSIKTKYVACDNTLNDPGLLSFLENLATRVIPIASGSHAFDVNICYKNVIEFIDDIYIHCNNSGEPKRNEIRYREIPFISYSRDDKAFAERLKNEFEKNGIRVFFDEDSLQTGDQYNQIIRKYIKDCDFFVALISENAIKDKARYVYEKEWRSAIVLNGYKDQPYIRPYIIDKTLPTDERIPEEIRNLNIAVIEDINNLGTIVQKFIKENKLIAEK
jgi:hypothetical protein